MRTFLMRRSRTLTTRVGTLTTKVTLTSITFAALLIGRYECLSLIPHLTNADSERTKLRNEDFQKL